MYMDTNFTHEEQCLAVAESCALPARISALPPSPTCLWMSTPLHSSSCSASSWFISAATTMTAAYNAT
jgi:hypothetical protein